ncbi:PREDICTED: mavicyanin-like [Camelina sativa]|uniref:Mavicyanin-like n=1 Tax=Camelina sativa TaxID=90675 RepID=A0ABM0ZBC2_CAMSA|nr:PREDICTED: mavicyanin-like [Camelina sativa]
MALIKSNVFFTSLLILVALFGGAIGGTVHKVGDSKGWTISVDYDAWASSKTFHVGDSLVFEYTKDFHDVTEVTHNDFKLCEASKPLSRYQTGSDTIALTKPGIQHFICGFPRHCNFGQKLQIHVLPASLGPVAAPVPRPVRSPSSSSSRSPLADSPVNSAPQYQMGPSPAPLSAATKSSVWIGLCVLPLLSLIFILV